jgi:hypothetical protein
VGQSDIYEMVQEERGIARSIARRLLPQVTDDGEIEPIGLLDTNIRVVGTPGAASVRKCRCPAVQARNGDAKLVVVESGREYKPSRRSVG